VETGAPLRAWVGVVTRVHTTRRLSSPSSSPALHFLLRARSDLRRLHAVAPPARAGGADVAERASASESDAAASRALAGGSRCDEELEGAAAAAVGRARRDNDAITSGTTGTVPQH
jgi:hypothetical protein